MSNDSLKKVLSTLDHIVKWDRSHKLIWNEKDHHIAYNSKKKYIVYENTEDHEEVKNFTDKFDIICYQDDNFFKNRDESCVIN
jgi:hypothetical protein